MIFRKDSYVSTFLAGISWFLYAYFFVIARDTLLAGLFLTLGGFFAVKTFLALYWVLRQTDDRLALTVGVLGVVGAIGAMVHGGFDLANALNPAPGANLALPSQIDPRGLLTFGITGVAVLKASWLMVKGNFPKTLSYLGFLSGILLLILYLGRLVILDPTNPVLKYSILIEGFIVNPLWYLWLSFLFWKSLK